MAVFSSVRAEHPRICTEGDSKRKRTKWTRKHTGWRSLFYRAVCTVLCIGRPWRPKAVTGVAR